MKILIVTYSLPPFGGIGGRRWAKFGRRLVERGHDVVFLSEHKANKGGKPQWEDDHEVIKDHIHTFESNYPLVLTKMPSSLMAKVSYRWALSKLKGKEKGNYFDRSSQDRDVIQDNLSKLIDQGYDTVIATGAPFVHLYYVSELRQVRQDFRFFADFRDPWVDQEYSYGFETLSADRKEVERQRQNQVIESADGVFTVADQLCDKLATPASGSRHIHTLPNGFDTHELYTGPIGHSDKLRFVYAGNLYEGAMGRFSDLIDGLRSLKATDQEVFDQVQFDFYGQVPHSFHQLIEGLDVIHHHGRVALTEAHKMIASTDLSLIFLIDQFNYSISTKFLECLAYDKPIMLFATDGDTSVYLNEHNIGYHYQEHDFVDKITALVAQKKEGRPFGLPSEFDKEQFDIDRLTDRLEELISAK